MAMSDIAISFKIGFVYHPKIFKTLEIFSFVKAVLNCNCYKIPLEMKNTGLIDIIRQERFVSPYYKC